MDQHSASSVIKALMVAPSGGGKTGALISLIEAGYRLFILDYDNGLDIIANTLRHKGKEALLRTVTYETIKDEIVFRGGKAQVRSPPTAFKRAGAVLESWNVGSLGPESILVLDTLNTFSEAGFNEALAAASRLNQRPQLQDYGYMAASVLTLIDMLTSPTQALPSGVIIPGVDCHVIVNTHVKYMSSDDEALLAERNKDLEFTRVLGLPEAKGQEISRNIGKYFNTLLYCTAVGHGAAAKRKIFTTPQGIVDVKTSSPLAVKPTYPIETGLADLFADILGHRGPRPAVSPPARIGA